MRTPPIHTTCGGTELTRVENSDHIAELGNQRPSKPFYFLKPASSIVPPHRYDKETGRNESGKRPMLIPAGVNVHYEVELAVIMAHPWGAPTTMRPDWKPTPENLEDWKAAIYGYAIGIISFRNFWGLSG